MSDQVTQGVRIQVASRFHPERSDAARSYWFFSYTVQIANVGAHPVQLLSRRWVITDAYGHTELVEGPGVVGETPRLRPGEAFRYTSFCPLPTSLGAMQGTYRMRTDEGDEFDAEIAAFSLLDPSTVN
jgi:ApaG protein